MTDPGTIRATLDKHGSSVLVVHAHADLDAVGSAVGLAETLDGAASVVAPDGVKTRARRLAEELPVDLRRPDDVSLAAADCVVVLDAPSSDRIAPVDVGEVRGDLVLLDHHERGDLVDAATTAWVDTSAGATAALAARVAAVGGESIDETAAFALAAGLFDDTGSLAGATTGSSGCSETSSRPPVSVPRRSPRCSPASSPSGRESPRPRASFVRPATGQTGRSC